MKQRFLSAAFCIYYYDDSLLLSIGFLKTISVAEYRAENGSNPSSISKLLSRGLHLMESLYLYT